MTQPATNYALSRQELAQYAADGFCVRADIFPPEQMKALLAAIAAATQRAHALAEAGATYELDGKRFVDVGCVTLQYEHQTGSDELRVIEPVNELNAVLDELFDNPRLVAPMQQLVGTSALAVWTAKLNLKPARTGSGFGWHQDSPYWVHATRHVDRLPNVYIALDDANEQNGCLCVIRASHKQGCLPGTADGTQLGGFFTDPARFDLSNRVALTLTAGSIAFFDPHLVHGSGQNLSGEPRRALIYTYQPGGYAALKSGEIREVDVGAGAGVGVGAGLSGL